MSEKKVVAGLSLDAGQFKQELEAVRAIEAQAAAGGEAFARSFSQGFELIEARSRKMSATIAEGGKVSERQFSELVATLQQLKIAAEAGGKSIEEAPEPIRKAFDVARQQIVAVAGGMQQTAAETARMREEFMAAGRELAGLATSAEVATEALGRMSDAERRAADLAEEIGKKFGDVPDRIEEIRAAGDKTFGEQADDLERIAKELEVAEKAYKKLGDVGAPALAKVRVESERVEQALKEVAAAAETHGAQISDAGLVAARSMENLAKQIRANPKEAVEQLPKAVGAVIQLRNAIEQAKAAGGPVDPGAVAQLQRFEAQLGKTKQQIGTLKREIDQQTAGVTSASQAWQGMDSVVDRVAGRFGKVGAAAVGGFAALKEGWAIGTSIAQSIGTDFSAMEQAVAKFEAKAKQVNPAMLDWLTGTGSFEAVRASITLTKEQFEGYNSAILAGIEDIGAYKARTQEFTEIHAAHTKILAEGAEGQRLATQAKRDGGGVMEDYVRSLGLASEAAKVHNKLVAAGAEGERLWVEIREKGKGTLVDLALAIRNAGVAITELTKKTKEQVTAEQELRDAVNDTSGARERAHKWELDQAKLIAEQEKATDGLTQSIRNKLAEIVASMTVAEGREIPLTKMQISQLEQLLSRNITLTEAERKKIQGRIDQLKAVESLTQGERELLAQDIKIDLQRNTSLQVGEQHRAVLDKTTRTISNVAAETGKLGEQQMRVATTADKAEAAAAKLAGGFGRLGGDAKGVETGVRAAGEGLSEAAKGIELAAGPTEKLSKVTVTLGDGLGKVADAASRMEAASPHLAIAPETIESLAHFDRELASIAGHLTSIIQQAPDAAKGLAAVGTAATTATGEE